MPRIQEYQAEREAQQPIGQTSPMLEQVQDVGRGIESFGRLVSDSGNYIMQRQTQTETSDGYAAVADQRQSFMSRIQNAANTGAINETDNPDSLENIQSDYKNWAEDQADKYTTPGGKNAFLRAATRAQGVIIQHATSASTVVAGKNASDQATNLLNKDSAAVQNDPTLFDSMRDNQRDFIESQKESGVWTASQASSIQKAMDKELSFSAARGMMQRDYDAIKAAYIKEGDKVDPNHPALNTADELIRGGHLDEFLDSDDKKKIQAEIRSNQSAAQAAGALAVRGADNVKAAAGAKALSQAYEDIRGGTYDPSTAFKLASKGLIDPAQQLQLNRLAESDAEPSLPSNARAFNNLMGRILSPDTDPQHISDPRELLGYVSKKGSEINELGSDKISADDFNKLSATLGGAQGATSVNRMAESKMMERARELIGTGSPHQQFQLMQFTQAVQVAKQDAFNNKKPLSDLFDPESPAYVGKKMGQYSPTAAELLGQGANDTLRGGGYNPGNVSTKPGFLSSTWNTISGAFSSAPPSVQAASVGAKTAPPVAEINGMSLAQLKGLNSANLPPEAREAARIRYNQLHAKGAK